MSASEETAPSEKQNIVQSGDFRARRLASARTKRCWPEGIAGSTEKPIQRSETRNLFGSSFAKWGTACRTGFFAAWTLEPS
jgi:hypothetical protein